MNTQEIRISLIGDARAAGIRRGFVAPSRLAAGTSSLGAWAGPLSCLLQGSGGTSDGVKGQCQRRKSLGNRELGWIGPTGEGGGGRKKLHAVSHNIGRPQHRGLPPQNLNQCVKLEQPNSLCSHLYAPPPQDYRFTEYEKQKN